MPSLLTSADGLVGYDTALTRRGSRVQFPVCVVVFLILFYNGYNKIELIFCFNFWEIYTYVLILIFGWISADFLIY